MNKNNTLIVLFFIFSVSCSSNYKQHTFQKDIEILKNIQDITILKKGEAMLAVSGAYQGRVFVSSMHGLEGNSLGYFNRELIQKGGSDTLISKLGGESRFSFGPEAGQFSIFFDPNTEKIVENLKISPELNTAKFKTIEKTENTITCEGKLNIRNAVGTNFKVAILRKITLFDKLQIEKQLGLNSNEKNSAVGFSTETNMTNIGTKQWEKETGLLSLWELACMLPSKNCTVIIPLKTNIDSTTNYFTKIDSTRIRIKDKVLYYKADAKYMNKIGIQPEACTNLFGSYSPELHLLNIVSYNFQNETMYNNCVWGNTTPYKGDVINIFNGEVNKLKDRNWPFFEMETLSAAKELNINSSIKHIQTVYHFEGSELELDIICKKVLGVSLTQTKINLP